MDEQQLRATLVGRVIAHPKGNYRIMGAQLAINPIQSDVRHVGFSAGRVDGTGDAVRGELHIALDTLNDLPYFLEAVDGTITAIVDGDLPPGTKRVL